MVLLAIVPVTYEEDARVDQTTSPGMKSARFMGNTGRNDVRVSDETGIGPGGFSAVLLVAPKE